MARVASVALSAVGCYLHGQGDYKFPSDRFFLSYQSDITCR